MQGWMGESTGLCGMACTINHQGVFDWARCSISVISYLCHGRLVCLIYPFVFLVVLAGLFFDRLFWAVHSG